MLPIPVLLVALYFLLGGTGHFIATDLFVTTMPDYLEYQRELVLVSGVFELLGGVGVLLPASRRWAGYGLIALCVAVFPANLNMALHAERFANVPEFLLYIRLPLQLLLIWFIHWATKPKPQKG